MEWIDCSDRLPDDEGKHYLVYNGTDVSMGLIDDEVFKCLEYMEIWGVSHWMPLPKPPTK